MYTYNTADKKTRLRSDDRVFVLSPINGRPTTTMGLLDKRLFSGENRLHAIKDPQTCLWHMRYDSGVLPEALKQKFTKFSSLVDYIKDYFSRRNVKIEEVID